MQHASQPAGQPSSAADSNHHGEMVTVEMPDVQEPSQRTIEAAQGRDGGCQTAVS